MKKQVTAFMLSVVMLLMLSGCQSKSLETSEISESDVSFSESSKESVSSQVSEALEETVDPMPEITAPSTDAEESDTSIPASPASDTESSDPVITVQPQESGKPETAKPTQTQVSTPEPTEKPKPMEMPTEEKTSEQTKPTETTEQSFDIDYWISFAKNYAQSKGLELDSSATECWDNPIAASSKSTCLERDIQSRINRYAKDEDISAVWIWAESIGNNSFELYIGYS